MSTATRYTLLRAGVEWADCSLAQLQIDGAGDVAIAPADPSSTGAASGVLTTAALDAGEESSWMRVAIEADVPASTRVRVLVAAGPSDIAPADASFKPTGSHDFWLPSVLGSTSREPESNSERFRYLWLRVHLESLEAARSPRLRQVRAQTAGEDFLSELPAVFAREDVEQGHYLARLLELLGSKFGDWDRERQHLPRRLDPHWAYKEDLRWLAEWLGWDDLPPLPEDKLRTLIDHLAELNRLRGTLVGLKQIIAAFMGFEVTIVEQFCKRPMWVLGDAELGIDTGLSPPVDGLVVPGTSDLCDIGRDENAVMVVGDAVVGRQGPLQPDRFGSPVFDEDAHRFTVFVPPGCACDASARARLRRLIDEEKPAHTDYHLCFLERMQLGANMTVGVDAYVGQAYDPEPLGKARLGLGTYVAEPPDRIRIGRTDHIHDGATLK